MVPGAGGAHVGGNGAGDGMADQPAPESGAVVARNDERLRAARRKLPRTLAAGIWPRLHSRLHRSARAGAMESFLARRAAPIARLLAAVFTGWRGHLCPPRLHLPNAVIRWELNPFASLRLCVKVL